MTVYSNPHDTYVLGYKAGYREAIAWAWFWLAAALIILAAFVWTVLT